MPPLKRVLVVDDDRDFRDALRDALEAEGYELAETVDGQSALDHLGLHPYPALILLDWNMAPMNGPQFMAELVKKPALAGIPIVLLTADRRVQEKAATHGFAGCLMKPVDLDALLDTVRRHCGG